MLYFKAAESLQIKGLTEKTMFPFATTRQSETEYSLLSPSAKRKKMHLMKSSSDKSEHNSSIEDISVTEQDNLNNVSIGFHNMFNLNLIYYLISYAHKFREIVIS